MRAWAGPFGGGSTGPQSMADAANRHFRLWPRHFGQSPGRASRPRGRNPRPQSSPSFRPRPSRSRHPVRPARTGATDTVGEAGPLGAGGTGRDGDCGTMNRIIFTATLATALALTDGRPANAGPLYKAGDTILLREPGKPDRRVVVVSADKTPEGVSYKVRTTLDDAKDVLTVVDSRPDPAKPDAKAPATVKKSEPAKKPDPTTDIAKKPDLSADAAKKPEPVKETAAVKAPRRGARMSMAGRGGRRTRRPVRRSPPGRSRHPCAGRGVAGVSAVRAVPGAGSGLALRAAGPGGAAGRGGAGAGRLPHAGRPAPGSGRDPRVALDRVERGPVAGHAQGRPPAVPPRRGGEGVGLRPGRPDDRGPQGVGRGGPDGPGRHGAGRVRPLPDQDRAGHPDTTKVVQAARQDADERVRREVENQ